MNLKRMIGAAAGTVFATAGLIGLSSQPASANPPLVGSVCAITAPGAGPYLTANAGGGLPAQALVVKSTATVGDFAQWRVVDAGDGVHVGLQMVHGDWFLTAKNGGGVSDLFTAFRTDRTELGDWEQFTPVPLGSDSYSPLYALQTSGGQYISVKPGGFSNSEPTIDTAATTIGTNETLHFFCDLRTVPDATGRFHDEAAAVVEQAGLVTNDWIDFDYRCGHPAGWVEGQSPNPGTILPAGRRVSFFEDAASCTGP